MISRIVDNPTFVSKRVEGHTSRVKIGVDVIAVFYADHHVGSQPGSICLQMDLFPWPTILLPNPAARAFSASRLKSFQS